MDSKFEAERKLTHAISTNEVWNGPAAGYLASLPGLGVLLFDLQQRLQQVEDHLDLDPETGKLRVWEDEQ